MERHVNGKSARRTRQRGSSLIEFALGSTILIPLMFGVADFGRIFYASVEVANAASAGATYGSRTGANMTDATGIAAAAKADAAEFTSLTVTSSQVCLDPNSNVIACTTPGAYKYAKVTSSYTFNTLFSYPGIASSVALSRTVMMRGK